LVQRYLKKNNYSGFSSKKENNIQIAASLGQEVGFGNKRLTEILAYSAMGRKFGISTLQY
jgi:hypothetical protein